MSDERHAIEASSRWWGEHMHRYNEALPYINASDTVLDIACGTGFGSDILAQHISGSVIGADISPEAVEECRKHWRRANLSFEVVDGTNASYPDNHFNKIVSFETIEHTTAYRPMLAEFKRMLKPGGLLILSTPNRSVLSPNGINNPYHTQEFTHDELRVLLTGFFPEVSLYGQRNKRYDTMTGKKRLGKFAESVLLGFGVRKLPIGWRTGFMKAVFGYPLYATPADFILEIDSDRIRKECPYQFAVCKK